MNINDYCIVRLTVHGEVAWTNKWKRSFPEGIPEIIRKEATLKDGRVKFQIWDAMATFGHLCYNGSNELPFKDNLIEFKEVS
jgi:hypothetical protein